MDKRCVVTGANGFLGAHLVRRLVAEGWWVTVYDRKPAIPGPWSAYVQGDLRDAVCLAAAMEGAAQVFHLAALADVSRALQEPAQQIDLNLVATFHVLEAMRATHVNRITFTSSAVVYGDSPVGLITERGAVFPMQTSVYGAMKLASESLISAYCIGHGFTADVIRLVSVVGEGYRHGNLMDFYRRLTADPTQVTLLGSRRQSKYYIAVEDVVDALCRTSAHPHTGMEIWNVSHPAPNTIDDSIDAVCAVLGITPARHSHGQAWAGDLPTLVLDCSKLRALGWSPTTSIAEGMRRTVQDFIRRGVCTSA